MSPSREQMIDYLYGELDAEALEQFEAALRESEQSRRELAELQATLRAARVVLARDADSEPPARVRDAVLRAAQAQLEAAKETLPAGPDMQPSAAATRGLRWLRSLWILPSLVAATAAALLVFRQHNHELTAEGPTDQSRVEVVAPEPPPARAVPVVPEPSVGLGAAAEGTSSGAATPQAEAPRREVTEGEALERAAPARAPAKPRSARSTSGERFATPPADWQRRPSADTSEPTPAAERAASADSREDEAPVAAELGSTERRESLEGSSASGARQRTAAPAIAAPSSAPAAAAPSGTAAAQRSAAPSAPTSARGASPAAPSARDAADVPLAAPSGAAAAARSETSPPLLSAAHLEKRAREHVAAKRWLEATSDYTELLRRFPEHRRRNVWTEQMRRLLPLAAKPSENP